MSSSEQHISSVLVSWYNENARDLPWRKTRDPYLIWVSEIILQQTTVRQGLAYYLNFVQRFPNITDLALAEEDEVLRLWAGLGYYSRARNMHHTARFVADQMDGVFPSEYDKLILLKGIGPYTAAAVSSFSINEDRVVIDGNVIRLISRLYGITGDVTSSHTYKIIQRQAQALLSFQDAEIFNQAIMEFGALHCVPKSPDCQNCLLSNSCVSLKKDIVGQVPFKEKKLKKKSRYFKVYHIVDKQHNTIIEKRTANDIWKGLYQFPLIEYRPGDFNNKLLPSILESQVYRHQFSKTFKQHLSHQKIHAEVFNITVEDLVSIPLLSNQKLVSNKALNKYAFPKFIDWYLSDNSIPLF